MPRISPEIRIGLRASATMPTMPSPNAHLGAGTVLRVTTVAIVTRTPASSPARGSSVPKPKLSSRPRGSNRPASRASRRAGCAPTRILQRLRREDRIRPRAPATARHRAAAASSGAARHREHLVDVRRAELEDALQAAVGRDRLDAQRHAIEERARRLRAHVPQPQPPALPVSGSGTITQRLRVLGDVAPALVEELERQRDVLRDRRSRRGSGTRRSGTPSSEQVKSCAGSSPWKQVASDSSVDAQAIGVLPRPGPRRLVEERVDAQADRHRRPRSPTSASPRAGCRSARGCRESDPTARETAGRSASSRASRRR